MLLELLEQVEAGYDVDYLACIECAEAGCSVDCDCICHDSAIEAKQVGRRALKRLRQIIEGAAEQVIAPDVTASGLKAITLAPETATEGGDTTARR